MQVIFCLGETLNQREKNLTFSVLHEQLGVLLDSVSDWNLIVIAYEPVWAIGTGQVATPEIAQKAHLFIREFIKENASDQVAQSVRIIYGGSVTVTNCRDLAKERDIDGFLVGGASLKPDFVQIVQSDQVKQL